MAFSRRLRSSLLTAVALVGAVTVPVVTVAASEAGGSDRTAAAAGAGGYWMYAADGGIFSFGSAGFQGATPSPSNDMIGMAATRSGNGYWMADDDGDVVAAGDATVFGSRASSIDNVAAFAARPQGDGYWLATRTGGLESYGRAPAFPGVSVKESKRITTLASTVSGAGAWMAAVDGGVFTFGDAGFFGSTGGVRLNQPVVGMTPTPSGRGYWLVASDGGIFSFGDAQFFGSTGDIKLVQPVVGMASTATGRGYWLVASDGGVFSFGDARFYGSVGGVRLNAPVRGLVAGPPGPDPVIEPAHTSPPGAPGTPGVPVPPGTPVPPGSPVATLVGAGDIAQCGSGGPSVSKAEASAKLLDAIPHDPSTVVFTAGDNAYDVGSAAQFKSCYDPTWGRQKDRTRPAPGNHEYGTSGAAGYFDYFGAAAGKPGEGWYSYNLGAWHVVVLNSNCSSIGGCAAGSAQNNWLRADLAASSAACTVAMWHHPRFNSGSSHGDNTDVIPLWDALYQYGADVILNGHEHVYERFAPQRSNGTRDDAFGLRQFTVGTGGANPVGWNPTVPNSERRGTPNGVLKLTLRANGYDWNFLPIGGVSFNDSGSGSCHGRP